MTRTWPRAVIAAALLTSGIFSSAHAQAPEPVYQQLKAIGQVVDVSCTAKLYRPMMRSPSSVDSL